jgi:serine/threonine-protein kinase
VEGSRVGPYQLARVLERGNQSSRYEAVDERTGRQVFLRVLDPALASDGLTRQRFIDKARVEATLDHPHILPVEEAGTVDGTDFVALRFVDAITLRELLDRDGRLELERALGIVDQIGEAIDAAHAAGALHRDLRPSAVLVGDRDRVWVTDFGIARADDRADLRPVGTPEYLAPEQILGADIDARTDLFALAVILFESLAGASPFSGDGDLAVMLSVMSGEGRKTLMTFRPDLPAALEDVLARGLAVDPADRYPTARDLVSAARAAASVDDQVTSLRPAPPALTGSGVEPARPESGPLAVDENVQFTVYRPLTVRPSHWYTLLAFAHLSDRRQDAGPDEPDPVEEVRRQAIGILGKDVDDYTDLTQDSSQAVPREGDITFVPFVEGIEFNPPSRTFRWSETVHREEFRLRAAAEIEGRTARGRLSVFLGTILLADVPIAIRVDGSAEAQPRPEAEYARPYRRIFASYSHRDVAVARQFERFAAVLGDRYVRDVVDLRSGEVWSQRIEELIREADVFQLFWSTNSMRSIPVQREWQYALALDRPNFVRPTYWESPLPRDPVADLPPQALRSLHFQRIGLGSSDDGAGVTGIPQILERDPADRAALPAVEAPAVAVEPGVAPVATPSPAVPSAAVPAGVPSRDVRPGAPPASTRPAALPSAPPMTESSRRSVAGSRVLPLILVLVLLLVALFAMSGIVSMILPRPT